MQVSDGLDDLRPVALTSGSFSNTHQKWSATDKKAFAVYQSVWKFNLYLKRSTVHTTMQSYTLRTIFVMWDENT